MRRLFALLAVLALVAAACGDDDAATTTTADDGDAVVMSPAEVVFEEQTSDGTTIVVDTITLPSPGFIAVHGNADGSPGPVIGHSQLLDAGTQSNVAVTLDQPLESSDLVFPMAHIDVNGNGEYEFFPPDTTIDGPAMTADGEVAVTGARVEVQG
ncbi:MAG: hypothetical protein R3290_00630 [Acidimicrobiia bacterium]|nr:hypothetical protein [Acidimicrobiia bacterium]